MVFPRPLHMNACGAVLAPVLEDAAESGSTLRCARSTLHNTVFEAFSLVFAERGDSLRLAHEGAANAASPLWKLGHPSR